MALGGRKKGKMYREEGKIAEFENPD